MSGVRRNALWAILLAASISTLPVACSTSPHIKNLRKQPEFGSTKACLELGGIYANGQGVRQDYAEAAKWFQKGAEQGDTVSQYNLGFLYYTGRGVPQDHAEAANWFWKSAVEGNPNAQFALGSMYDNGDGVKQDYEKASKWYLKAAMQGDANAQFALGSLYFAGQGVPQDFLQSYYWSMAKAIGASEAITAGAVISGAYFGDKMTPLSETTILTPQIVGSNVYAHIRSMSKATIPSYLIALVGFFLIGLFGEITPPPVDIQSVLDALSSTYTISLVNLIPILVLLLLGLRKYPAFLSILIGALVGALVALVMQPQVITAFANDPSLGYPLAALKSIWVAMANGFTSTSGYPEIDTLFSGGGMDSMLTTVWLILGAMSFGAMMDFAGFNGLPLND